MRNPARYFFVVQTPGQRYDDQAGAWLTDDEAALARAKILIRELKQDSETDYSGWLMVVQNAMRQTVFSIPF